MKYRYDKTRVLDEQIEAQDLTELRDAYEDLVLLQEDYWQLKEIRDALPTLHPLFTDASKRMCDARTAYTGALALVQLMASERAMRAVSEAPEKKEGEDG